MEGESAGPSQLAAGPPAGKRAKVEGESGISAKGKPLSIRPEAMEGGAESDEEWEEASEEEEEEEEEREGEGGEGDEMSSQVKQFFAEFDVDQSRQRRRLLDMGGSKGPRRKSVLPAHLRSVMGSANLRLARGDSVGTIELCQEVIRQAPHSPEPYLTLATVYADIGETDKLLQILLIVSHLKRSDGSLWVKTGELALKKSKVSLAARCYSKAYKLDPKQLPLLWQSASLFLEAGELRKALEGFEQLQKGLPSSSGQDHMEVAKEMARIYHSMEETESAVNVLRNTLHTHTSNVDDEAINLLSELLVVSKRYHEAFEVLVDFYGMASGLSSARPAQADVLLPLPLPLPLPGAEDHMMSHEHPSCSQSGSSPPFSLSAALQMTMSQESVLDHEPVGGRRGDGEGGGAERGWGVVAVAPHSGMELKIPEDLPVDLRSKLAVCLIHMGLDLPEGLLGPIVPYPEEYGDLFLDVADAYTDMGDYPHALPLLSALVNTHKFHQAGVWLKHAESLHMTGDLEGAAVSYSKVLSLAPQHTDTRLALANVYTQLGMVDDALAVLDSGEGWEEEEEEEGGEEGEREGVAVRDRDILGVEGEPREIPQDIRLLLQRYSLLQAEGRVREYSETGADLLSFLYRDVYHRSDTKILMLQSLKVVNTRIRETQRLEDKETTEMRKALKEQETLLSLEDWWGVFHNTCRGLYQLGPAHHSKLRHLIYCAKCVRKFETEQLERPFVLFVASIFHLLGDNSMAFTFLKHCCTKNPKDYMVLNLINYLPTEARMQKFLLRQCFKHPSNPLLMRAYANHSHSSSSYKLALSQYATIYRQLPDDYLLCLCIAVVYLNMGSQMKLQVYHRNTHIMQAVGFLHKYSQLRGSCQESMYNTGRAFHQLGILHVACHFYKQVLVLEPECRHPQWSLASDLRPEAAFNLSLIYRASGNRALAHHYLSKYCRI